MLTSTYRSKWQSLLPFSHQSSSQRLLYDVSGGSRSEFLYLQYFLTVHFCWFWGYQFSQAFENICTGCSWTFTTILNKNGSYHALLSRSYVPQKIDPSCSMVSLKTASLHGTKLVLSLSNSTWYYYLFHFFAENVFSSFILAFMPSYRAYRFFKLIAWTTSNVEQRWNLESSDLYQIHTLQRYYHHFLVMLGTFNEYHRSDLVCGALISYKTKTNTVGHTVYIYIYILSLSKRLSLASIAIYQSRGLLIYINARGVVSLGHCFLRKKMLIDHSPSQNHLNMV